MQATSVQPGQQVRLAQVTIIIFPFNRKDELDRETRNMAALLAKFRIDFSSVLVIPGKSIIQFKITFSSQCNFSKYAIFSVSNKLFLAQNSK